MPDYKAKIRIRKGTSPKEVRLFAPSYEDAEKDAKNLVEPDEGGEVIAISRADEAA